MATIRQFEGGATEPRQATLLVLRQALESAGVEFIDENGGGPGCACASDKRRKDRTTLSRAYLKIA